MIEGRWSDKIRFSQFNGDLYYAPMKIEHLYNHTKVRLHIKSDFTILDNLTLAIL